MTGNFQQSKTQNFIHFQPVFDQFLIIFTGNLPKDTIFVNFQAGNLGKREEYTPLVLCHSFETFVYPILLGLELSFTCFFFTLPSNPSYFLSTNSTREPVVSFARRITNNSTVHPVVRPSTVPRTNSNVLTTGGCQLLKSCRNSLLILIINNIIKKGFPKQHYSWWRCVVKPPVGACHLSLGHIVSYRRIRNLWLGLGL